MVTEVRPIAFFKHSKKRLRSNLDGIILVDNIRVFERFVNLEIKLRGFTSFSLMACLT